MYFESGNYFLINYWKNSLNYQKINKLSRNINREKHYNIFNINKNFTFIFPMFIDSKRKWNKFSEM